MCKLVFLTPKSIMTHKSYFKKWSHFLYIYMYTWNCHYYVLCLVARLCLTLGDPIASSPPGSSVPGDSRGKNTGVGFHALLQGIFPTQGSNPGLQHCREILYQLSHKGSPRILEWVAIPSPEGLPDPGIQPGSPALQVDSLPIELSGKP